MKHSYIILLFFSFSSFAMEWQCELNKEEDSPIIFDTNFTEEQLDKWVKNMSPVMSNSPYGKGNSQSSPSIKGTSSPQSSAESLFFPPTQDEMQLLESHGLSLELEEGTSGMNISDENGWYCAPCDTLFQTESRYETHMFKHATPKICLLCRQFSYVNKTQYDQHLKLSHFDKNETKTKKYVCVKCNSEFVRESRLQNHKCRDFSKLIRRTPSTSE